VKLIIILQSTYRSCCCHIRWLIACGFVIDKPFLHIAGLFLRCWRWIAGEYWRLEIYLNEQFQAR
jgi:hypothetical protein